MHPNPILGLNYALKNLWHVPEVRKTIRFPNRTCKRWGNEAGFCSLRTHSTIHRFAESECSVPDVIPIWNAAPEVWLLWPSSGEAGEVWVPVGLLSAGKLLSFKNTFFDNYNLTALFDKMY